MSTQLLNDPLYLHLIKFFNQFMTDLDPSKRWNTQDNQLLHSDHVTHARINTEENSSLPLFPIKCLIGLSGGLDSVVLLDLIYHLYKSTEGTCVLEGQVISPFFQITELRALYVNHGLSPHAKAWGEHCQQLCDDYGIMLIKEEVLVDSQGRGIEAGARQARYQAYQKHLALDECLLTAQHQDDQAETFLLALKRGSGLKGLSAMKSLSVLSSQHLQLRPLLDISRKSLEAYALKRGLRWVEDESNQEIRFERNFLRQSILPLIEQRWPYFSRAVAKSAALCQEELSLLFELLDPLLEELSDFENQTLLIAPLKEMSKVKRQALLKRWCESFTTQSINREQLRRIWDEVALSEDDRQGIVELGLQQDKFYAYEVRRYQNKLYLVKSPVNYDFRQRVNYVAGLVMHVDQSGGSQLFPWASEVLTVETIQSYFMEYCRQKGIKEVIQRQYIDLLMQSKLEVRFNLVGSQKVLELGASQRKTLKHVFQNAHIPPWQRPFIPMIYVEEKLLLGLGVFVCHIHEPQLP